MSALVLAAFLAGTPAPVDSAALPGLARAAVLAEAPVAESAVATLRRVGPAGLDALLALNDEWWPRGDGDSDPRWPRVRAALEAVAAQRDAHAARLYWYSDFDQALAAARASGRPILSLRLLGRLDEEASCANSRFFRTVLYANAQVSQALREGFVLHWRSVRPVPRVVVDMGDGRRLESTVTGNSVHYVLDARGRVVDALPGLYGPGAFLRLLSAAERLALRTATLEGAARQALIAEHHRKAMARVDAALAGVAETRPATTTGQPPTAGAAGRLAEAKLRVEQPVLGAFSPGATGEEPALARALAGLAARHAAESRLDAASRLFLARKHARRSRAAGLPPAGPAPVIRAFEAALARDSARNEYVLRRPVHAWFAAGEVAGLDELNARVYAELFLTPSSDPWLGLISAETYAALE